MKIRSILDAGLAITYLSFSLLVLWLSLGWRVRKARKAFERQLIRQGMSKKDARRLSAQFLQLKNKLMSALKSSVF